MVVYRDQQIRRVGLKHHYDRDDIPTRKYWYFLLLVSRGEYQLSVDGLPIWNRIVVISKEKEKERYKMEGGAYASVSFIQTLRQYPLSSHKRRSGWKSHILSTLTHVTIATAAFTHSSPRNPRGHSLKEM